jgi:hypothetical protein
VSEITWIDNVSKGIIQLLSLLLEAIETFARKRDLRESVARS